MRWKHIPEPLRDRDFLFIGPQPVSGFGDRGGDGATRVPGSAGLGPGPGSCNPRPRVPVFRTSLTSCTFSSSRVGSSTIPGMAAAAPDLRRRRPLRRPRLLELPFGAPRALTAPAHAQPQARRRTMLRPTARDESVRHAGAGLCVGPAHPAWLS